MSDTERQEFEAIAKSMRDAYNKKYPENARFNQAFHNSLDAACELSRQGGFQDGYAAGQASRASMQADLLAAIEALERIKKHQESNVKSNTTALMGTTWHIATAALQRLAKWKEWGMAIDGKDGKWRVSVDGQLDMPFDTHDEALEWAAGVQLDGFDCYVYYCPPTKQGE